MEDEAYFRADQNSICPVCNKRYGNHPREEKFTEMGERFYPSRLCDGRLVKL